MAYLMVKKAGPVPLDIWTRLGKIKKLSKTGKRLKTTLGNRLNGVTDEAARAKIMNQFDDELYSLYGARFDELEAAGDLARRSWGGVGKALGYGAAGLGTLGGGALLYGAGKQSGRATLTDWQKDPMRGADRYYIESKWSGL
jgi:hypothetical protein